jgi:hypothetical protein
LPLLGQLRCRAADRDRRKRVEGKLLDADTSKQYYVFMRTTLDLPDDLLKRAKIAAVERGTTLRQFVGEALERELRERGAGPRRRRVRFPIFDSRSPGALRLTNARIAALEADEDVRRHGRAR